MSQANHRTRVNFIEKTFLTWIIGLLRRGFETATVEDELLPLTDDEKTEFISNKLGDSWAEEINIANRNGKRPQLYKALLKASSRLLLAVCLVLKGLDAVIILCITVFLKFFLEELSNKEGMSLTAGSLYVAGLSLCTFIKSVTYNHTILKSDLLEINWKASLTGLVYRKLLNLTRGSLSDVTTGKIMNLISNDIQRLDESINSSLMALFAPVKIVGSIVLLVLLVGWQSLAGLLFVVLVTIYSLFAAKQFASLRARTAVITDKRLEAINDIIRGIRAVKMYAWEWNFRREIETFRRKEVILIRFKSFVVSVFVALFFTTSSVATLISVITLVFTRELPLPPSEIFTLVPLMKVLEYSISGELGECARFVFDAKVTIDRIENFLLGVNDEINHKQEDNDDLVMCKMIPRRVLSRIRSLRGVAKVIRIHSFSRTTPSLSSFKDSGAFDIPKYSNEVGNVKIRNMSAGWNYESQVLQGISLEAASGQLVIITGPVGSGKTTLLMAIQGELPITTGSIQRSRKIAYVSQTPWVFSATVRENITFGREFNKGAYENALRVCDLNEDVKRFPKGDLSIVGQRGVSLSGGQRARVSLARAVYTDADIFLLDDPMSAVDANVGVRLFWECICGALAGKTRLLVTHQLQYLQYADYVVLMKGGKVEKSGPPECFGNGRLTTGQCNKGEQGMICQNGKPTLSNDDDDDVKCNLDSYHAISCHDNSNPDHGDMAEEEEDRVVGRVKFQLYWTYFRAALPSRLIVGLIILLITMEASILAPNWWLNRISDMSHENQKSSLTLGVYGAIVGWTISYTTCVLCLFLYVTLRSSERLHNRMTTAVLKSPILFFDTNPLGRIMNRFSKDVGTMDEAIPTKLVWALTVILEFIGRLIFTAVVEYRLAIAVVPVIAAFLLLCWFYLKSSRELQRIESIKCSTIYAHFTDTLSGLEVIKAAEMKERFWKTFVRRQDERTMAAILVKTAKTWMTLYVDLLCSVFVTAVAASAMIFAQDPADIGMLLSLAVALIGETSFGVFKAAEVENEMTSVERVVTYTKLPCEPGYSRTVLSHDKWPDKGAISLRGLSLTYRQGNPRVLHDLNVDIPASQRVGITGRTGSGKSSLVAALLRLPEPQGQVLIDGIDLGAIDIQSARRAIAVIAQDPVLFGGSLRNNMDPFHKFSDQEIWASLEEVQLLETIQKLPGQLDFKLGESGTSFSIGERQLLCLARALLQKSKVLVLDEATANVDYKTDLLVQQVLRNKFTDCTLLTIAHRLNTIMDYDKVLVMDKGRIVEFDKPDVLVRKKNGVFARLARSAKSLEE